MQQQGEEGARGGASGTVGQQSSKLRSSALKRQYGNQSVADSGFATEHSRLNSNTEEDAMSEPGGWEGGDRNQGERITQSDRSQSQKMEQGRTVREKMVPSSRRRDPQTFYHQQDQFRPTAQSLAKNLETLDKTDSKFDSAFVSGGFSSSDPLDSYQDNKSKVWTEPGSSERGSVGISHEEESDIVIPECEYPIEFREGQYDGLLIYCEEDREQALEFQNLLHKDSRFRMQSEENINLCNLDDNFVGIGTKISKTETVMKHCTFILLFITEKFCKDTWSELQRDEVLMMSLKDEKSRWSVVPVHTQNKKSASYKIPFGLKALKGIDLSNKDEFFYRNIKRLFEDRLYLKAEREKELKRKLESWKSERRHQLLMERRRREHEAVLEMKKRELDRQKAEREAKLELERKLKAMEEQNEADEKQIEFEHEKEAESMKAKMKSMTNDPNESFRQMLMWYQQTNPHFEQFTQFCAMNNQKVSQESFYKYMMLKMMTPPASNMMPPFAFPLNMSQDNRIPGLYQSSVPQMPIYPEPSSYNSFEDSQRCHSEPSNLQGMADIQALQQQGVLGAMAAAPPESLQSTTQNMGSSKPVNGASAAGGEGHAGATVNRIAREPIEHNNTDNSSVVQGSLVAINVSDKQGEKIPTEDDDSPGEECSEPDVKQTAANKQKNPVLSNTRPVLKTSEKMVVTEPASADDNCTSIEEDSPTSHHPPPSNTKTKCSPTASSRKDTDTNSRDFSPGAGVEIVKEIHHHYHYPKPDDKPAASQKTTIVNIYSSSGIQVGNENTAVIGGSSQEDYPVQYVRPEDLDDKMDQIPPGGDDKPADQTSIMKSIPGSVELPPAHPPKPPLADYTTSTTGAKGHQPPTEVPSGDSATPLKPHQLPSSAGSAHGLNIHSLSEITSLHPDKPLPSVRPLPGISEELSMSSVADQTLRKSVDSDEEAEDEPTNSARVDAEPVGVTQGGYQILHDNKNEDVSLRSIQPPSEMHHEMLHGIDRAASDSDKIQPLCDDMVQLNFDNPDKKDIGDVTLEKKLAQQHDLELQMHGKQEEPQPCGQSMQSTSTGEVSQPHAMSYREVPSLANQKTGEDSMGDSGHGSQLEDNKITPKLVPNTSFGVSTPANLAFKTTTNSGHIDNAKLSQEGGALSSGYGTGPSLESNVDCTCSVEMNHGAVHVNHSRDCKYYNTELAREVETDASIHDEQLSDKEKKDKKCVIQ